MLNDSNKLAPGGSDVTSNDVTPPGTTPDRFSKFTWFTAALDAASAGPRKLHPAEWRVLCVAWDRADGRTGQRIRMYLSTYHRRAAVTEATARNALRKLCELEYLQLVARGGNRTGDGGKPSPNVYRLNRKFPKLVEHTYAPTE